MATLAKALSRESIFAAPVAAVEVEVPEWGGTVRVRRLSHRARLDLLDTIAANEEAVQAWRDDQALPDDKRKGLAKVEYLDQTILTVLFALVDDDGARLFTLADYDRLAEMDYDTLGAIWLAAMRQQPTIRRDEQKKSSD